MEKIGIIKRIKGTSGSNYCEIELENGVVISTEQYGVRQMMEIANIDNVQDLYGMKVVCYVKEFDDGAINFMESFNFVDDADNLI